MESSYLVDDVVKDLEEHEQTLRIKKLIFCACRNSWENNTTNLDKVALKDLVQELRALNPNIDQLRSAMDRVVETLNRQELYSSIANILPGWNIDSVREGDSVMTAYESRQN